MLVSNTKKMYLNYHNNNYNGQCNFQFSFAVVAHSTCGAKGEFTLFNKYMYEGRVSVKEPSTHA